MRVTIWRRLIRRSRMERFLREQSVKLARDGHDEGAFVLLQVAENLRMGMSLGET